MICFQGWNDLISTMCQKGDQYEDKGSKSFGNREDNRKMHQANRVHTFAVWGGDLTFGTLLVHGPSRKGTRYTIPTRLEFTSPCTEGEKDRRTS